MEQLTMDQIIAEYELMGYEPEEILFKISTSFKGLYYIDTEEGDLIIPIERKKENNMKKTTLLEKLQEFTISDVKHLFEEQDHDYLHDILMEIGCTYFKETDTYVY